MDSLFKEKKNVDVLICGAGPVGLFLANELAEFEVNFRIIEKLEKHPKFSKALLIAPRTMEIFDNRQLIFIYPGLLDPFLEHGVKLKQSVMHYNVHDSSNPIRFDLSSLNSSFAYGLINRQNKTEEYLIDALHKKKSMGKKNVPNIEFGMELVRYKEEENKIIAVVKNTNNVEEEITCQYLVGCDGVHSTVRKGISGWTYEGQTLRSSWALADLEIDHELHKHDCATAFAFSGGILAIESLDVGKNTVRIIFKISEEESKHETNDDDFTKNETHITLEELQKLIDERIAPIKLELKNPVWISNFRISERIVNRYRMGRAFVAGGMNLGIQDAHNLAFKLALAISCQAADVDKLIDSYEQERYPVGKKVVSGTGFFRKVWSDDNFISKFLRTSVAPFMFHFFPQTSSKIITNLFQSDFNYLPETSGIFHKYKPRLSAENKLIKAGHYALDGLLKKITNNKSHERITMFDIFRSTALKHTLILFTQTNGVTVDCNPLIRTLLEIYSDYKSTITPIIISYHGAVQSADIPFMPFLEEGREQHIFAECKLELHEKYGITKEVGQQAFVLVRPDLYVASAVFGDDVDELKAFLERYLIKANG
ncbi:13937_t:CDS:2 [Dentiscutata erythropus]|uniref:13937_t:CDS:1 n=1 Tax=Dentiscutata erythropus TaxID=1348616 RepID=A0A9N9H7N9_9GLOM|nr:13937_t:CDS:2 [Dentiscutata erythropus]